MTEVRSPGLDWLRARAGRVFATAGIGMLAAYLGAMSMFPRASGRVIVGDATHHFVQLRSVVFDGDLHFQNDYMAIYDLQRPTISTDWIFTNLTTTGHVRNYMPVGPAILWAPLYIAGVLTYGLLAAAGLAATPDGFEWALQLTPGITGIAAATTAAWLSWRLAARFTHAGVAAFATLATWIGTHALYYSLVSPAYSHSASMLASAVFFFVWIGTRDAPSIARAALWGALAGAAALMRWQDGLFLAIVVIDIVRWRQPWRTRIAASAIAALSAAAVFTPQMIVWYVLYGQPLAMPQGPAFMHWTAPHLLDVLLSDNHGLITWAPMLAFALVGLVRVLRVQRDLALPIAAVCLASWYVNAAVADWWAGEAFGARRFLSLFPLFAIGLARWLDDARARGEAAWRTRTGAVVVLTGANLLLLLQYQLALKGLQAIAPYPHGWFDMWIARFLVPGRLLTWWVS